MEAGILLMSEPLPPHPGFALRLKSSERTREDGTGGRNPFEEQMLDLFDELRQPLLRYLLSLRVLPERSEEILQETFLKLFEHLKSGRPDENVRGWLFRVAHNLALQDLRSRRSRDAAIAGALVDRPLDDSIDPGPNPEQQVILDQREARLLEALGRLPETEQRCLHLRAEGLRYREIAEVLHISVTTVADCLRRAIASLRKEVHG